MKDYYCILGVIKSAEDIVIKAAYRALAQKYHPDKFEGDEAESQKKMQEINEAYSVLSDSERRKEYDRAYDNSISGEDDDREEGTHISDEKDQIWREVVEYYPDLLRISSDLEKISKRLVQTFKYHILETKDFENRKKISEKIEKDFLINYFGFNEKIFNFGRLLILCGFRKAAKKLNRAVDILGVRVDPTVVINKILENELSANEKVFLKLIENRDDPLSSFTINTILNSKIDRLVARSFIRNFRGDLTWHESFSTKYYISSFGDRGEAMDFEDVVSICKKLAEVIK